MDLDPTNPEQIKMLISMLQSMLPNDDTTVESNPKKIKKTKSKTRKVDEFDNPNIKTKSTRMLSHRQNKFLNMPEMNMHKADTVIDKKLSVQPPCPRTRSFEPVKVVCRSCKKTEEVNPAILDSADRYKCNKCSTMAGG
jgi:hypothetical protein